MTSSPGFETPGKNRDCSVAGRQTKRAPPTATYRPNQLITTLNKIGSNRLKPPYEDDAPLLIARGTHYAETVRDVQFTRMFTM